MSGKIKIKWGKYLKKAVRPDASADQIAQLRDAFYAGVFVNHNMLVDALPEMSEEEAITFMKETEEELNNYFHELLLHADNPESRGSA